MGNGKNYSEGWAMRRSESAAEVAAEMSKAAAIVAAVRPTILARTIARAKALRGAPAHVDGWAWLASEGDEGALAVCRTTSRSGTFPAAVRRRR